MSFVVAPGRKTYHCYKTKEHKAEIVGWLAAQDPRGWHAAADIWNWDGGHDVLALISEQPTCDRATVQLIFARSSADYYLSDQETFTKAKNDAGSVFNMVLDILARWRNDFYMIGKLGLPDDEFRTWANIVLDYQLAVIDKWNRDPALMLPRDFIRLTFGQTVDTTPYFKTIPESMQP